MSDATRPFSTFVRDHRPLSGYLEQKAGQIDRAIRDLRTTEELEEFARDRLPTMVTEARTAPPRLGGGRSARVDPREFVRRRDGSHASVARHWAAFEIEGDAEALTYWPDAHPTLPTSDEEPSPTAALTLDNFADAWQIGYPSETGLPMLYTSLYLTVDEEAARVDARGMITDRRSRVTPIVEAIATQANEFNDALDARIRERLDGMRDEFRNREEITASLDFPYEWLAEPLALDVNAASAGGEDVGTSADVAPGAPNEDEDPDVAPAETTSTAGLTMSIASRLAERTFEQVQQIIRIWANSVERYPRSFAGLNEDQISDLLAATLNATTPGANREVYSHSGKSDIFVRADVLSEGRGPEKILIIESKWATSKTVVQTALDPQLFGYLTAKDTAAILLVLIGQHDFEKKRGQVLEQLQEVEGFEQAGDSAVSEWPILRFAREGRTVRICVAPVHLDRTNGAEDARARGGE
ncbi:hypothetical protein DEI81_11255 [Curtobacterium sp. MCBD17_013]|uniref:hypothetical protein n=1 Tax=Curtobacterium sp. MCBD17_013 TaxID=2175668 RepID=UPI000DA76BCE|nr:hypothetical protein [Curtobacterium sp. MCBD17_013]PZF61597.1 hypothetical protein DEI81_11255 [Curtobacterium sp. MCBD17_013]